MRIRRLGFLVKAGELSSAVLPWKLTSQARLIVKVTPFLERQEGKVCGERISWEIPVGEYGEVAYPEGEDDPAVFAMRRSKGFISIRALRSTYEPLLCAAGFCLFCLNAVTYGYVSLERLTAGRGESMHLVRIEGLGQLLHQRGEGEGARLSHALRACRDEFLP
jgi:hypothetical protein